MANRNALKTQRPKLTPLRRLAQGQPCTVHSPICNADRDTVVLAHLPGAGMGTKSHDIIAVHACSDCHDYLDRRQGMCTDEEFWYLFSRALIETLERVDLAGLLPPKPRQ